MGAVNKILTFLVLVSLQAGLANGQHVKEDLKKINQVFFDNKKFSLKVVYGLYPNYTSTTKTEEKVGIIKKKDNFFYASYFGMEIYEDKLTTCTVNHTRKTIVVEKNKKGGKPIVPDLDKALKLCSSVKYDSLNNNHGRYTFDFKDYIYVRLELEFDRKTYLIKKVTYYYGSTSKYYGSKKPNKQKLEVLFSDVDFQPQLTKEDFSTKKYFTKKSAKGYLTTPAYRNYKIKAI